MQAFHLPIAVGSVRRGADVFDMVSGTKGIESSSKFGTIVGSDSTRVTKELKDFLADGISNGGTTFIID
jgi:hypothetical protein